MSQSPKRAILFDLDGTLVDSLEDMASALDRALVEHGLATPARDAVRSWVGHGAKNLVARAVAPELVDTVLARFRVHYEAHPIVHTQLYAGVAPVLDALTAAGHTLAVLTNKPHELAVAICAPLLAPWPFAAIVGARAGVALKPDPAAALAIAAELAIPPERWTMVGDSEVDIEMAQAAGMRAVAVSWGFRPRSELALARPALLVDEPAGLHALVD